jgi:NAD(P)-dependent dehydrogenase (short-subunit alcohol dehydrogenase family)
MNKNQASTPKPHSFPPQAQQDQPGQEHLMVPTPDSSLQELNFAKLMENKVVLITGGDSGIGRATARLMAQHGANISIVYFDEKQDAQDTRELVEETGQACLLIQADIKEPDQCKGAVEQTINDLGKINCLINNAAVQFPQESMDNITADQLDTTFRTNIYSYFYFVRYCLPHLSEKDTIINTTSVTAYRGSKHLLDYSSTKGAIVSFTRSLALMLADQKIRVNAVAPGPVWTPLIPSTFPPDEVAKFGQDVPMGRAGQPDEIAPSFLFLASELSSYMTGQILHPNGGEIINT